MKSLKPKLVAIFEFVRRERIYFFAIFVCLVVTFLSFQHTPSLPEPPSAELELLQQQARAWNQQVQDQAIWANVLMEKPGVVAGWFGMMLLFSLFFAGGSVLLILKHFSNKTRHYFQSTASFEIQTFVTPLHFFRVSVLIYMICVVIALITNAWVEQGVLSETSLGIVQTLALDTLVCLSVFAVLKETGITWETFMGARSQPVWAEIKRGVAEYLTVFPWFVMTVFCLLGLAAFFHYEPPPHPLVEVFAHEQKNSVKIIFYGAIILAAVAAPVMEEIFFRGFCYRLLKRLCGMGPAFLFSAAFFAAIHGSWFSFPPIFLLGWFLARLYEKRGNLIACWTFHVLHNILFTAYFFNAKAMIEAFHG